MSLPPGNLIEIIVVAPFVAALLAPLLVRQLRHHAALLLALVPAAVFGGLWTLLPAIMAGAPIRIELPWVPSLGVDLALAVDGLGLTFALTVAGIGALVVLYSGAYLKGHPQQGRFLAFLLAFMGAMLGLVLADGLVPLYVFWELTAVTSYLLIGFDHTRQAARRAALQALLITSGGGLCLLLGVVLLHAASGQWTISAIATEAQHFTENRATFAIVCLFFVAAFTKSAQVPFHFWLPNAMEAPTPVSAYLHSAAMVQAGIYLLLRFTPIFSGSPIWLPVLTIFGGVTMLWGAAGALRQTDLKQVLAHSTISSLGLLVLLIGLGGEGAIAAAVLYFIAHALYKAGFFLVVGLIDHETGLRDMTALGGLRDKMSIAFIGAILAGFSMLGLPPVLGYLAKEEIFGALGPLAWGEALVPVALVLANAALGALALALVAKPFLGHEVATPKSPHEGPVAMLAGPIILGLLGVGLALLAGWTAERFISPAVAAVLGHPVATRLGFAVDPADPTIWLSLLTWALGAAIYWKLDAVRTILRRLETLGGWTFDRGFDLVMTLLWRVAQGFATGWQNGRLRFYVLILVAAATMAAILPFLLLGGWPIEQMSIDLTPVEGLAIALAIAGLATVLLAPSLIIAILALGVQGTAVALIYLLFGGPDLSFTQFMIETLSVVLFALLLARLRLDGQARRERAVAVRDAIIALFCGGGVAALLLAVTARPFDDRLGTFFAASAAPLAHGRNIVNVILVDFRGLDTLGEISVVMTAGIAVWVLISNARQPLSPPVRAAGKRRRSPRRATKPEAAA